MFVAGHVLTHLYFSPMPASFAATAPTSRSRLPWLDGLRVLACFLVMLSHSTDDWLAHPAGAWVVAFVRPCVPLFIMISGALLLPMPGNATQFLRRRLTRVVVPFLIWGVLLALLPLPGAEPAWAPTNNVLHRLVEQGALPRTAYNLIMLPINFTGSNIHFWFLYVIIGLYLFIPVISPWVRGASTRALWAFLGVWGFTLCLPYLQHFPGHPLFPAMHGECDWNNKNGTYYFGGYLGYLILGHALTRVTLPSRGKVLWGSAALFVTGWLLTTAGFAWSASQKHTGKNLEFFIENLSPNVAFMAAGLFLACRAMGTRTPALDEPVSAVARLMAWLSILSFGSFLIHYWVLQWVHQAYMPWLVGLHPFVGCPLLAVTTFAGSFLVAWLVSLLPGRKWLLG